MRGNPEGILQPKLGVLCLNSYNWFRMWSCTPRSGRTRRNKNSLCWEPPYSWRKHQQGPGENISCQCSNSQQLRGSAVIHSFCLTWEQSLPTPLKSNWNSLGGDAHKTVCVKFLVYLRSSHVIQLF